MNAPRPESNDNSSTNDSTPEAADKSFSQDNVGGDKLTVGDITDSTVVIGTGASLNIYHQHYEQRKSVERDANQKIMLTKMRLIWVDGLLERSLQKSLRIPLKLETRPSEVDRPIVDLARELQLPRRELGTHLKSRKRTLRRVTSSPGSRALSKLFQ